MSTKAHSLNALAEDKGNKSVNKITSFRVDPNKVVFEEGFNLRADDAGLKEHIDRLAIVYEQGGFVPPIDLRVDEKGKMTVVEGHCRVTAARRVREKIKDFTIEARQFRGDEKERVLHMLGTGNGQKPLSPLEQGQGFIRLLRYGMKPQEIADRLGITRVTVENNLQIAEAPADVQEMVKNGEVSATTARQVVKKGAKAIAALKEAAKKAKAAPQKKKNGKKSTKKAVTAKKLKGTAADTKKKKAAKKAAATPEPTAPASPAASTVAEGEVSIVVKKDQAAIALQVLKLNGANDIADFIASLELALI